MAIQSSFLLLGIILALAGHALASSAVPTKRKEDEIKHPDWFIGQDGSFDIPGIGRVKVPIPGFSYGSSPYHAPRSFHRRYRSSPYHRYSGNGGVSGLRYGSSTHRVPRTRRRTYRSSPHPLYNGGHSGTRYGTHHVPRTHRGYRSSAYPRYNGNRVHSGVRYHSPAHHVHRTHHVHTTYTPDPYYTGSDGHSGGSSYGSSNRRVPRTRHRSHPRNRGFSGPRYIPGGDDTFVPNPGYEVPIPTGP